MRSTGRLIAAGLAAFIVFMVVQLPAAVVLRWAPPQLALSGLEGTLWSGSARQLSLLGQPLGRARWRCNYLRILLLQWSCELRLLPAAGELRLDLTRYPSGAIDVHRVDGRVPVASFAGLAAPPGWSGDVEFDLQGLRLEGNWLQSAAGAIHVRRLRAPGPGGAELGDFELTLGEGSVGGGLSGRLSDRGGPLRVRGTLELSPPRNYLLSGEVSPGPGATDTIFRTLEFLGPPDSLGRRPFTIEGSL